MKEFIKWFIDNQFTSEKSNIWKDIITNLITMILVSTFIFLLLMDKTIEDELKMLLSMVLGYYFNSNNKNKKTKDE